MYRYKIFTFSTSAVTARLDKRGQKWYNLYNIIFCFEVNLYGKQMQSASA